MNSMSIFLVVTAAALLIAAAVMGALLLRLLKERSGLAAVLNPPLPHQLVETARFLQKSAQGVEAGRRAGRRLEQLLTHSPLPVLLVDENRTIVTLSSSAETELDQPRAGRGLLETLESYELDSAAAGALSSLKPAQLTVRLYAKGRRPYVAHLFPFSNGPERECLIFLENAAATVGFGELRSQFAATVSHELRTPLAGIKALVDSLKDPEINSEDRERFLERIDLETGRLGQLIDDILFLSSLESDRVEIKGATPLDAVMEKLMEKLNPLAQRFNVRISADVPEGLEIPLPERMADTVLANLIENAVKYSGRGSLVSVSARREAGGIRVAVKDDGIGIDQEHLPHIFERFYRVDKSRSRHLGGTGLGLSIVKHVIESAGGEITAESREGFGTEISFLLPPSEAGIADGAHAGA